MSRMFLGHQLHVSEECPVYRRLFISLICIYTLGAHLWYVIWLIMVS